MTNNKEKTEQTEKDKLATSEQAPKNLVNNFLSLLETYRKLVELELNNGLSTIITAIIVVAVFLFFAAIILFFVSLGAASMINRAMGFASGNAKGLFIVAGFYTFLFIIALNIKGFIKKKVFITVHKLIEKIRNK